MIFALIFSITRTSSEFSAHKKIAAILFYQIYCFSKAFLDSNPEEKKKENQRTISLVEQKLEVSAEPMHLFDKWFKLAENDPNAVKANIMCLATATKSGLPSARFMTLTEYSKEGFLFLMHYGSRKGEELGENPNAAIVFYWDHCNRSVRIEGTVGRVRCYKSEEYFRNIPYDSQIASLLCEQTEQILDISSLECKEKKMRKKYPPGKVPRPPNWGGYILKPHTIEFWQGHGNMLHERLRFRRPRKGEPDGHFTHQADDGWVYEKLCP
ncbi:hypothetical protein JTB14_033166 [Gonioctena quinquepunctata]|nr:hypothetical protein JTB14_033166 [Gonioctena quinquepunctata]